MLMIMLLLDAEWMVLILPRLPAVLSLSFVLPYCGLWWRFQVYGLWRCQELSLARERESVEGQTNTSKPIA